MYCQHTYREIGGKRYKLGRMFAIVVDKRDARTLIPLLKQFVRPGSTIISDCWRAYFHIDKIHANNDKTFKWYLHQKVNHSKTFKDPVTGAHTNTCEGAWRSQYKAHIPKKAYSEKALQGHLFERMWKRKYQDNLWDNLWRVLAEVRFETECAHQSKSLSV